MDKPQLLKRLEEVEKVCVDDRLKMRELAAIFILEYLNDDEISKVYSELGKFKL